MTPDSLRDLLLSFVGAEETFPFGPDTSVFKVGGKMFALSALGGPSFRVSLKCEPRLAEALRAEHAAVIPGYHLSKRHWNTVILDGSLSDEAVKEMIEDSYDLVVSKLPRAERTALGWENRLREDLPPIQFLAFEDCEEVVGEPPGFDGVQLNRRLFDLARSGTPQLIADVITFEADFIHHMHRHFNADQVMVPLRGSVVIFDESRAPRELRAGEAMVVPRYRWHEVRNQSGADCVVLNLFSGVGEMSEVGFEAFPRD